MCQVKNKSCPTASQNSNIISIVISILMRYSNQSQSLLTMCALVRSLKRVLFKQLSLSYLLLHVKFFVPVLVHALCLLTNSIKNYNLLKRVQQIQIVKGPLLVLFVFSIGRNLSEISSSLLIIF